MTTREQMIDKGRHAILERRGPGKHRGAGLDAEAVVDALLPQVSTVEELEALPHRSIVVDRSGRPWIKCRNATHWRSPRGTVSAVDLQHFYGRPLTVVRQP